MFTRIRSALSSNVAQHIGAFLCIVAVMLSVAYWFPDFHGAGDLRVYERIANDGLKIGQGLSTELHSEYPPLATTILASAVRWMPGNTFAVQWAWFLALFLGVIASVVWRWDRTLLPVFSFIVLLFPWLFSANIAFGRYDILVWGVLFLSLFAWRTQRYGSAAGFLVGASLFKVVPILLLPFLFFTTPRHGRRKLLAGGLLSAMVCLTFSTSMLSWQGVVKNTEYVLSYHGERGIQVESTWSGVQLLFSNLAGTKIKLKSDHMSIGNPAVGTWALTASKVLIIAAVLIALALLIWRRALVRDYFVWSSVILLLAIGFSPVFSPQYVLWVIPTLLIWACDVILKGGWRRSVVLWALVLTLVVALLTKWVYPLHYTALVKRQEFLPILILNIRNVILFLLMFVLAYAAKFTAWLPLASRPNISSALLFSIFLPSLAVSSWLLIAFLPHAKFVLAAPNLELIGSLFLSILIISTPIMFITGGLLLLRIVRSSWILDPLVYTGRWLWTQCRSVGRTSSNTGQQLRLPLSTSY